MVRGGQNAVPDAAAAVAAYLGVRRQRQKASSLAMRRSHQSWFANQDNAVVQAMVLAAASCNNGDRRVVPRALGGWRGSTLAGYLTYDDIAYVANFRATRVQLNGITELLKGSALDSAAAQRSLEARLRGLPAQTSIAVRRTFRARQSQDPPTLRFKVALCMYALGQGGPIKPLADAGSVGESALRRYLAVFADAVMAHLKRGLHRAPGARLPGGAVQLFPEQVRPESWRLSAWLLVELFDISRKS